MDLRMIEAAQTGNINALYELIQGDPYLLQRFDQVPFLDTPLHLAAAGSTEHLPFVMEMINLQPSFARKLNPAGLSPMHLALQCDNKSTVFQLLKFDKDLVRVKGKEGITPLHHAVQFNLEILIEFLEVCPEAIEDVTVRGETAFHIALKHDMFTAFQVLVGWLRRSCHKDAQNWEKELLQGWDIEGNTVLHVAVIKKLPLMVKLSLENFSHDHDYINARNLEGLTAVDIAQSEHQKDESQSDNQQILDMLKDSRGSICSLHVKKTNSSIKIDSLRSKMTCYNKLIKTAIARGRGSISEQMRNAFLVVAVLIITATYTACVNPPGIIRDITDRVQDNNQTNTVSSSTPGVSDKSNIEIYIPEVYSLFWLYNTLTFWGSVGITAFLLPSCSICLPLLITLSLFGACYMLLIVSVLATAGFFEFLSMRDHLLPDEFHAIRWYHGIWVVNYIFSLLLALLVAYRIGYHVCLKLARPRRMLYLVMSLVCFLPFVAAIIFPYVVLSEHIWKCFKYIFVH